MKYIQFVSLFALVLLLSCKKDAQVEELTAPKVQVTTTDLFFSGELDYDHAIAQIVGEKMRMVVPVKNSDGHKSYRYKISEHLKDGDPARTGYILSLKEINKETDLFSLPINSKGSYFTNNKENGLSKDQQGKIVAKVKSDKGEVRKNLGEVLSLYANCGDLPQFCIDWYYVTYDANTGNVVNEIYVYTTCYDPCSFNSNPNGGGSTGENCNNVANQLKGGSTSDQIGIASLEEQSNERKLFYTWRFFKQNWGMWEFRSVEIGTHRLELGGNWKWYSLTHDKVEKHGWTVGGTLNCTATALPQVGIYNAGMQLSYNITASVICKGSPINWDYSGIANSPFWHVNQTPQPLS